MKVLFAVSECVPFIKTGGLADVAGSLPKELKRLGTDVRVILPKYGMISDSYKKQMKKVTSFYVQLGWRMQYCGIEELKLDDVTFYFVDNEYYFKRDQLYGFYDDGERFGFFNRAVLEAIEKIGFYPDVIHCHDWHTGMIPFLYKVEYQKRNGYGLIRTVFTIHNLQFQGIMPKETLQDILGLDERYFHIDQLEFYGNINFMKGAIVAADKITTVSPTYRNEIQTEYYGEKLNHLLIKRDEDLDGILNGIDDDMYHPLKDSSLVQSYSADDLQGKAINKAEIQRKFALPVNSDIPLLVMITRLTRQKGLDLVQCVFDELLSDHLQMIVLGSGDASFEHFFREMEHFYPTKFKAYIGFDEDLAHRLYAGADLFLMPSQFEPCGLGQLIAMKYGAIPIVRETGGLNDTVHSFNEATNEGNGFSFTHFNAHDMLHTIRRASSFYQNEDVWDLLVKRAMNMDYSWAQSAFKYNRLYSELISRSESHVF
ncbi:glycogen synthase GlgA [Cytobacillus spongiae]|uniref:glycogen synthase GlgA n=1 Tax=Cytobacillus spongiae TaxID=2901381 RepID=UPI001F46CAF6|nr:glycogen synthase GlgA [Cytobacillus spongiae]UII55318.1 glycogen synthase GlgA [Cytobacillus spongiae]